jgi:hypothetical protein
MCHYRKEVSELGTANDFEGSMDGIIDVLSQQVPGGTDKHHGKLSHDYRRLGCDLKLSTPKYISEALPLEVTWEKRKYSLHINTLLSDKQSN